MLEEEADYTEKSAFYIQNEINTADTITLPQTILDEPEPQQELQQEEAYVDITVLRSIQPDSKSVITEENLVLQKLLRRWRYFDYRDGSSYKKKRAVNSHVQEFGTPCYVCGQFQHSGKRCPKRRICSACKSRGHIAKDCPMNNKEGAICLRCGETGHELFSCNIDYSTDDLKNIHCYVCNKQGHIFCGDYMDICPATASCYNCGESGHSGLECPKPLLDKCGSRPPSICYKCGEGDHVARKCTKDVDFSACRKRRQASGLDLGAEEAAAYENPKRARRSKTNRHNRVKQKMRRLLEYMTTV